MLDDPQLLQIAWSSATGIRAPEGEALNGLVEFTLGAARAALGLARFAPVPTDRATQTTLSDELAALPLDVVDDLWTEHAVRSRPTDPALVHRYVFHVALLARPDRTDTLPLRAPAPETLEWLWSRGVGGHRPGDGLALGAFVDAVLVRARHRFLAEDRRLEDWELLEALDGDIVPVDGLWSDAHLPDTSQADQTTFRRVVGWYLATRVEGGGLTLGPTSTSV